jgi:large subunit ribosomal protein L10
MPITKAKKNDLVKDFSKKLENAESIVFVKFSKLPVSDTIALRRKLRADGIGYTVIKKTLAKRVLDSRNIKGERAELPGEIAFAYSNDLIAPAREVYNFSKDHKEQVSIVGGVFEGSYMDANQMLSIATIPPIEVLYGQFVGMLASPVRSFVVALDQIAKQK